MNHSILAAKLLFHCWLSCVLSKAASWLEQDKQTLHIYFQKGNSAVLLSASKEFQMHAGMASTLI